MQIEWTYSHALGGQHVLHIDGSRSGSVSLQYNTQLRKHVWGYASAKRDLEHKIRSNVDEDVFFHGDIDAVKAAIEKVLSEQTK